MVVKLEVGSIEKKNLIKNDFKLNFIDLFNISSTLKKIRRKYEIKGDVKIFGYQEGGFAARINSIFGNGQGFSHCSSPDLKNCQMTLAGILDYFSNEFPLQFEPYYRDRFGSGAIALPSTSFPLIYATQSYCKLPSLELPENFDCQRSEAQNQKYLRKVSLLEKKNVKMISRLENLKEQSIERLSIEKANLFFKLESQLKINLKVLNNAKTLCRKDRWSCPSIVTKLEKDLHDISESDLNFVIKEDRIKICLESSAQNTIGSVQFKFIKSESLFNPSLTYKKYELKPNGCLILRDPSFTMGFQSLEVSVSRYTEKDPRKCKYRRDRKFFSGYFWDLKN